MVEEGGSFVEGMAGCLGVFEQCNYSSSIFISPGF